MRKLVALLCCVLLFVGQSMAQTRKVTGTVKNSTDGTPLPGVSVTVKGGTTGTQTAADGTFSIDVPSNTRTLIFSFVGFGEQEVSIVNRSSLDILLTSDDRRLQEVVVVGYGTQQRRAVTASISKVDPEPAAKLVTPSLDKQLAGRAAGVTVVNSSGLVNQPPRIRVRGVNSITGNRDPLIVIDGVPSVSGGFSGVTNDNLLADINPQDVESIEILKDGAASAIYGSRAANGVIIITTKKGRAGRSNVNYSVVVGASRPYQKFDLLNADQFVEIANEKLTNAGLPEAAFLNNERTNTDWQEYVYRDPAYSQIHNLSLDGGNDRSTFFLSFNYANQQGLVTTNKVLRYGLRANIEHKVNKWLKIGNNLTLSRTYDNDQNNGGNALSGAVANSLRALPNVRVLNPDLPQYGGYNVTPDGAALGRDANTRTIENNYTNIAFVLNNNKFDAHRTRIINNAFLEIKPFNFLTWTTRFNVDYISGVDFLAYDPRHGDGRGSNGIVQNNSNEFLRWTVQNLLNLQKSFGNHNLSGTLGYEAQLDESKGFTAFGSSIADRFFLAENVIGGSYATQQSSGYYQNAPGFISYFGRFNYDYNGKYFFQASYRRDGLSRFADGNRFGTFPGFSAGWRISEEDFFRNSALGNVFSDLKLRGSWARVGNQSISGGLFPFLSTYGNATYGGTLNGIAINLVGNPGLQWETADKTNFGLDMAFLNNRFNFSVDYFISKNNNQVLAAPQPVSFGIPGNQITQNIGDMENRGWEFTLGGAIIRGRDFTWDFDANFTYQTNEVKSLYRNLDVPGAYNILKVGEPINALYGFQYAGVNAGNGNPMYIKADGTLIQGNIANSTYYTAKDGSDPALGDRTSLATADRRILGNVLPKWFGGVTNTWSYKGLSLYMFWRFSGGNKIFNLTAQESLMNQAFLNNGTAILRRWQQAGDVTDVPRLWYGRDNFTNLQQNGTSRFVEDGNFLRLDNLRLAYSFDRDMLNRVFKSYVKSINVFVQGQNLLLITNYTGIDPENISEGGIDNNTVPQPRTISLGLNIGF